MPEVHESKKLDSCQEKFVITEQVKPKLLMLSERVHWFCASCSKLVYSYPSFETQQEGGGGGGGRGSRAEVSSSVHSSKHMPNANKRALTYWTAYSDATRGSSPGVSCPWPQRGSRKMLMLGAQKVRLVWPTLCMARASTATARASVRLKAAAEINRLTA
ncbi:hypothetical protein C4D60_Mb05t05730 [Musa balbisiana]|uniref:Uncharacterized protein n=1 Tax=Musa balbisiana TaxID=52838 RepID=A0A4S8JTZ0_MUSBA|nr:hypothetical protein C4D60_Mb05t05730 [Musa balbisiana]